MKIKSIASLIVLMVSSVLFISVAPSQAGECSPEDPCQTYAMVDTSGTVINIIVCQPSVCGSGVMDGVRVVPQVAADSNGQNRGGFFNTPGSANQVTVSDNVFTVHKGDPVEQKSVEVVDNVATTTTVVTGNGASSSFTFESTVGVENVNSVLYENEFSQNTSASVKIDQTTSGSETMTVGADFQERQTLKAVEDALNAAAESEAQVQMVTKSISRISSMLRKWLRWLE